MPEVIFFRQIYIFQNESRDTREVEGGGGNRGNEEMQLLNCANGICQYYFCTIFCKDFRQLPDFFRQIYLFQNESRDTKEVEGGGGN